MNITKKKLLLAATIIATMATSVGAQTFPGVTSGGSGSNSGGSPIPVITPVPLPSIPPGKGDLKQPRKPEKVILYCGYDYSTERLYFSMPESIEYLSVTVQDTTSPLSWDSVVYPETPYMEAELGGSTYTIECVSGDGTVYGTTVDF